MKTKPKNRKIFTYLPQKKANTKKGEMIQFLENLKTSGRPISHKLKSEK